MTHKQNHRNKNKEQKYTCNSVILIKYFTANKKRDTNLLLIMGEKKLIRIISSVSISKKFIKKRKKRKKETVNKEVVHINI